MEKIYGLYTWENLTIGVYSSYDKAYAALKNIVKEDLSDGQLKEDIEDYYSILVGNFDDLCPDRTNDCLFRSVGINWEELFKEVVEEMRVPETLFDTVELMESSDYKDRFKAEYYQTRIRYKKLNSMIEKYKAGTLDFEPTCDITILESQRDIMVKLLGILRVRAKIEEIEVEN